MSEQRAKQLVEYIQNGQKKLLIDHIENNPADLYIELNMRETLLHKAAYFNQPAILEYLIHKGLDINSPDNYKYTPLHEASRNGSTAALEYLLIKGADRTLKNKDGRTPEGVAKDPSIKDIFMRIGVFPEWSLVGNDSVAHIIERYEINRRMTEIFNFRARSYTLLTENLQTKAETAVMRNFGDFETDTLVQEAAAQFQQLGGKMPETTHFKKDRFLKVAR